MSANDEECIHGLALGTCTHCAAKGTVRRNGQVRGGGPAQPLDTPEAVEKYRSRYVGDRESTFEAYVAVFFSGSTSARSFPGGWTNFSRCGNAEPALVRDEPELVRQAEELMRLAGYEADDSGRPAKGRRWVEVT